MREASASRTALVTALMRAIHTRLDPEALNDDPWGDWLVPDSVRSAIRASALAAMDAAERARALTDAVAAAGEPFRSGFDPAAIAEDLRASGFALREDLDGEQLARRSDGTGADGLRASCASHIAHARVAG
jgi:O-methyltransferase involved in polyketide biosynthesis